MSKFCQVLFSIAASTCILSGQTLLPGATGNKWTLNSPLTPQAIVYTIGSVQILGPRTVMDLQQSYPWATYSLLVSQSTNGIAFEGFKFNGATMWNVSPVPLFKLDATVGQSWDTPLGRVSLVTKTATVESGGRQFTGVHVFDLNGQWWHFAPNFGIVQFSVAGLDFSWTSGISNPSTVIALDKSARACPKPGIASVPEDGALSDAAREGSLLLGKNLGSRNQVIGAPWSELEPTSGTFNLTRIDKELKLAAKHSMETVFTLRVPQNVGKALPADLGNLPFNDSRVLSRMDALLKKIIPLLPANLKWVNFGYEVDSYLNLNPTEGAAFKTLFDAAKRRLKIARPGLSVGIVFNFDSTRAKDSAYRALLPGADHVAFTYYAITDSFDHRDSESPLFDIPLMISYAGGKPMLLVELGYSSVSFGQTVQADFFSNAFAALRRAGGSVPLFAVWSYRDTPQNLLPYLQTVFGTTSPKFTNWISSLGLVSEFDVPKLAFTSFSAEAPQFNTGTLACTAN